MSNGYIFITASDTLSVTRHEQNHETSKLAISVKYRALS